METIRTSAPTRSFDAMGWAPQSNGQWAVTVRAPRPAEPSFLARLFSFLLGLGW